MSTKVYICYWNQQKADFLHCDRYLQLERRTSPSRAVSTYLFIADGELRTHPRISVLVPSSTYLRLSKVQQRTTVVAFSPHILLVYHMLNDVVQLMGPLNLVRHCQACQNAQ